MFAWLWCIGFFFKTVLALVGELLIHVSTYLKYTWWKRSTVYSNCGLVINECNGCFKKKSAIDEKKRFWFTADENSAESQYVDLLLNRERYTGYKGASPQRIWKAIYEENCFKYGSFGHLVCFESVKDDIHFCQEVVIVESFIYTNWRPCYHKQLPTRPISTLGWNYHLLLVSQISVYMYPVYILFCCRPKPGYGDYITSRTVAGKHGIYKS